jgi:hypothetical protein
MVGPARPAGQLAARPGRPGLCARRSDRRGSSMLRFRAPARAARADRRAAALAAAAALSCPANDAQRLTSSSRAPAPIRRPARQPATMRDWPPPRYPPYGRVGPPQCWLTTRAYQSLFLCLSPGEQVWTWCGRPKIAAWFPAGSGEVPDVTRSRMGARLSSTPGGARQWQRCPPPVRQPQNAHAKEKIDEHQDMHGRTGSPG